MPGPAPSPNARRRNDKDAWRILQPVYTGEVPAFPLKVKRAGLAELWRHLWTLPQAELWAEQNAVRLVARYALLVLAAERAVADVKIAAEVRQIEDRLLISPEKRIRARVLIAERPTATTTHNGTVTNIDDYRDLDVG